MKLRSIVATEDGSSTLCVPGLNECYHSVHGAIQESMHIFIRNGVESCGKSDLRILEAGFGTGLNALLALLDARKNNRRVEYHSFEKYPLTRGEAAALNYPGLLGTEAGGWFRELHEAPWDEDAEILPCFRLHKHLADFGEVSLPPDFDLVFFDAFSPDVQPRLWGEDVLGRFCCALKPGGVFVTYCVKGAVKQTLRRLGMTVKRLPGPPGKREMLRAVKNAI